MKQQPLMDRCPQCGCVLDGKKKCPSRKRKWHVDGLRRCPELVQ